MENRLRERFFVLLAALLRTIIPFSFYAKGFMLTDEVIK